MLVASDQRRKPFDQRILGCSVYRMQTALMVLEALLGTLALLLVAGVVYQIIGTWRDRRRFPPPRAPRASQRETDAHPRNRRRHTDSGLRIRHGRVLPQLDAGAVAGGTVHSRGKLRPRRTRLERSARAPRTARQIAQELRTLLGAAGVPAPYVLVGHSFGGYVNRAFAHMYCNEVIGMVPVDSVHPAEWENPTPEQLRMIEVGLRYAWIAAWLARLGFVRFCLARLARGSPKLGWAAARAFGVGTASAVQRIADRKSTRLNSSH